MEPTTTSAICPRDRVGTKLACAHCRGPICPGCLVRTDVGFKCPACAGVGAGAGSPARGRRRWPLVLVVAGLVATLLAVRAGVGGGSHPAADPVAAPAAGGSSPSAEPMLGEEATDGQLTFVVTDVDCPAGGDAGRRCRLHLRARNRSGGPALLLGRFQYLLDGASKSYGPDLAASAGLPENGGRGLSELTVNPDVTVDLVLLYDLPAGLDPVEAQLRGTGASRFGVRVRLQHRDGPAPACPAAGHQDTFVSGLTPDRIPTLPSGYSFSFVQADGCTPVRFDPCQPVHYVLNPAAAPATGPADVREAFARLGAATGITFVDDGTTDEVARRSPVDAGRYPGRWAPILVVWTHQAAGGAGVEVVGAGFPLRAGNALVSGQLTLNADAIVNRAKNTPMPGGFGPAGAGAGAIGADGVTWGRVILHELAHVLGLGHTRDRDQLMYPDTAEQTAHTTDYRSGDRDGLRLLGRDAGCVPDPPAPPA